MRTFSLCLAGLIVSAGLAAAETGVMHCFAFTPIEGAGQSDWDAFYKATNALPQKIKGLKQVWAGKLARPLGVPALNIPDPATRKKMMAEGKGNADFTMNRREYGACMWFENEAAFKAYGADPAHKEWEAVYSKVRRPGTTTYQILAQ